VRGELRLVAFSRGDERLGVVSIESPRARWGEGLVDGGEGGRLL
jgi:hypothetical protein